MGRKFWKEILSCVKFRRTFYRKFMTFYRKSSFKGHFIGWKLYRKQDISIVYRVKSNIKLDILIKLIFYLL